MRTLERQINTTSVGLFMLLLSAAFAGCGGGSTRTNEADQQAAPDSTMMVQDTLKALERRDTEDPYAGVYEMGCVRGDAQKYIHHGTTTNHQHFSSRNPKLEVMVSELQSVVGALTCANSGPVKHGVIVHHGLTNGGEYDAFLQVVCLTYHSASQEYEYTAIPNGYTINGQGQLIADATGLAKWYTAGKPGHTYRSKTVIQHDAGGSWTAFVADTDVESVIFPYEGELDLLIANNSMTANERLLLEPIAEPQKRDDLGGGNYDEKGFWHGVAWTPVDRTLDNTSYPTTPYLNKAADLGSPCPVTCAGYKFQFKVNGLAPRTNC